MPSKYSSAVRAWLALAGLCAPWLASAQNAPAPAASASAPAAATTAPIPFVSAHAADFRTPSAPDAWGGPQSASTATLSNEVVSYTIDATLHPDPHTVDASEVMTWHNRSDRPVRAVYMHMYLNAFEGAGSLFFTERRMFAGSGHSRGNAQLKKEQWGYVQLKQVSQDGSPVKWSYVHPDGGPDSDHTVAKFELPQAVPAHGTLTLHIDFHDKLPRVVERTGWFGKFHLVAQWFPKIAVLELPGERGATAPRWNAHAFHFHSEFYADYGNYDVHLSVPKGYTVGAVGHEEGKPVDANGTVTYHYVQKDVEDFAWVAAPGYKVQDTTWTGPGSPKVDVKVIYPPEYPAVAKPILKATTDALTYFSSTLGPYPYHTVTAVVPPYNAGEAGGMEYPTFFTAEHAKSYTKGTLSQYEIDFVTIHEFGHGYFMGILGSNEFEEPMLDEGMNQYWDERMLSERHQDIHLTTPFLRWLGIDPALGPFEFERLSGVVAVNHPADPLDANSWDRLSSGSYGSVYSRTASTMHTLENLVGHDAMSRAMKLYYQRWKFRHPSAADLRVALEDGTGKPQLVDRIFDSQVYGTRKVDDRVVRVDSTEQVPRPGTELKDGKRVTVTRKEVDRQIRQARKDWARSHRSATSGGPYPWLDTVEVMRDGAVVPETLKVTFADGTTATEQWDSAERWHRFQWTRDAKVVAAELDPQRNNFLDADRLNNSYAVKSDAAATHRWSAAFSDFAESFYSFLVTL